MNLRPKLCDVSFRNAGNHSLMDSSVPSHRAWIPNGVFIQTWKLCLCVSWCWQHKDNYWCRLMCGTACTHKWSALIVRMNITDDSSCSSGTTIFLHYKYRRAVAFMKIISACKCAVWENTDLLSVAEGVTCRTVTRLVQAAVTRLILPPHLHA